MDSLDELMKRAADEGWDNRVLSESDRLAVRKGYVYSQPHADHVVKFFRERLCLWDGEWYGKPFELMDWQREGIIEPVFGWVHRDTGLRRYQKAFVEIAKKNGKSSLCSGIGLFMLTADGEPGAGVFSAATSRSQAGIVHAEAIKMADASPSLSDLKSPLFVNINRSTHNIAHSRSQSFYRAISAEAKTAEGLKAHCIIADELHAWYGRKLWDSLKYAFRTRRQPLLFVITTAGDDLKSVCWEQHERATELLAEKKTDIRQFCYVRAMDDDDDWLDQKVWFKANPSLGITIKLDDFTADAEEARQTPTSQASFMRYSLNKWVSGGKNKLLDVAAWKKCGKPFDLSELADVPCWGGLDLSKTRDMTAFALVFKLGPDDYRVLVWFWLPAGTLNDRKKIPEFFRTWRDQEFIRETEGDVCDYRRILDDIAEICQPFRVVDYGYDPWNAEHLTQELTDLSGIPRVAFKQSIQNYNEPTKELQRLILNEGIVHNNNPVLNWQADNACGYQDGNGNVRPMKPESDDIRKIDGIAAMIMALGRAESDESEFAGSAYKNPGDGVVFI